MDGVELLELPWESLEAGRFNSKVLWSSLRPRWHPGTHRHPPHQWRPALLAPTCSPKPPAVYVWWLGWPSPCVRVRVPSCPVAAANRTLTRAPTVQVPLLLGYNKDEGTIGIGGLPGNRDQRAAAAGDWEAMLAWLISVLRPA